MKRFTLLLVWSICIILFSISCSNNETNNSSQNKSEENSEVKDSVEVVDTIEVSEDIVENDSLNKNTDVYTLNVNQDVIDFLALLVGEYSLESVDGYIGASMMEFLDMEEGVWKGTGYVLSDSGREDITFDLTEDEIQELESMKIVIDEDFNFSLECRGEKLIELCLYCTDSYLSGISVHHKSVYFLEDEIVDTNTAKKLNILKNYGEKITIEYYDSELKMLIVDKGYPETDVSVATYYFKRRD